MNTRKGLGQFLQEHGVLSPEELKKALAEQEQSGLPLRAVLENAGLVGEIDILKYFESELGFPRMDSADFPIDPEVTALVPEEVARRHTLVPAFCVDNTLSLVMADPLNLVAHDEVRRLTNLSIEVVVATTEVVIGAINRVYGRSLHSWAGTTAAPTISTPDGPAGTEEGPTIRLVNTLISQAACEGASDIHIEPEEDYLRIRFRIDGVLREVARHPISMLGGITARIKVMADLDLAEKRRPQDGRARLATGNSDLDLRVSTFPTLHGENTVLRLLQWRAELSTLDALGFSASTRVEMKRLIERPHGLFLVTGPTGSGKTTTLYACLNHLNSPERNIATLEDPVEYRLSSIRQTQVEPECELTFARGLRSLLRQDPDVIMVGEIRDVETAEIAIRSSLTGHLVLSTLHTNDAIGALIRFTEMGTEPYLVARATLGVLAQRLVRAVCPRCRKSVDPPPQMIARLRLPPGVIGNFVVGEGCVDCRGTGYKGRVGVYELLVVNDAIRDAACSRAPAPEVARLARESGFRSMREDALVKAVQSITTLDEVLRVTTTAEGLPATATNRRIIDPPAAFEEAA